MKKWFYLLLFYPLSVTAAPLISQKVPGQLILTASTTEYPDERSEIYVKVDPSGWAQDIVILEIERDKKEQDETQYSLAQVNAPEGVVLKEALTVPLIILKGTNLNKFGGSLELRYRESNWSDDFTPIPLHLTRNAEGKWVALAQDKKKDYLKVKAFDIKVWKGIGFGIEKVRPIFAP